MQRAKEACLLCRRAPMVSMGNILCGNTCMRAIGVTWPCHHTLQAYPTHEIYDLGKRCWWSPTLFIIWLTQALKWSQDSFKHGVSPETHRSRVCIEYLLLCIPSKKIESMTYIGILSLQWCISTSLTETRNRTRIGNVAYTYHGTTMVCRLGSVDQPGPCSSIHCSLCSILGTSFRLNKARANGA